MVFEVLSLNKKNNLQNLLGLPHMYSHSFKRKKEELDHSEQSRGKSSVPPKPEGKISVVRPMGHL